LIVFGEIRTVWLWVLWVTLLSETLARFRVLFLLWSIVIIN